MQAAVGGRMRLFISGGAPLPKYAGDFMATAMNVPVLQVCAVGSRDPVLLHF
jgi:long-subunit acyl-CoA synthetase (AMP-forming)